MTQRLFAYGTLVFPEVLRVVIGRSFRATPARLVGYARFRLRDRSYPGIVETPGASVEGLLYSGVDGRALAALDRYEDEPYERVTLAVTTRAGRSLPAQAYVVPLARRAALSGESWDGEAFRRLHLETFLAGLAQAGGERRALAARANARIATAPERGRAAIFDMDGLLLDTETIYRRAWQRAAGDLGYLIDDALYERFLGCRTEECERMLRERFGADFPLATFHERWRAAWHAEVVRDGIRRKPGVDATLELLEREGVPAAVATSTPRAQAELSLARAGLAGRFPVVVTGDGVAAGKPAPDIFLAAASRLGVAPGQAVAFEDAAAGVLAAAAAGMYTILVPDLARPSPEVVARAHQVLRSLEDAPAALRTLWRPRPER